MKTWTWTGARVFFGINYNIVKNDFASHLLACFLNSLGLKNTSLMLILEVKPLPDLLLTNIFFAGMTRTSVFSYLVLLILLKCLGMRECPNLK